MGPGILTDALREKLSSGYLLPPMLAVPPMPDGGIIHEYVTADRVHSLPTFEGFLVGAAVTIVGLFAPLGVHDLATLRRPSVDTPAICSISRPFGDGASSVALDWFTPSAEPSDLVVTKVAHGTIQAMQRLARSRHTQIMGLPAPDDY